MTAAPVPPPGILDQVRTACRQVSEAADLVRIDHDRLAIHARELAGLVGVPPTAPPSGAAVAAAPVEVGGPTGTRVPPDATPTRSAPAPDPWWFPPLPAPCDRAQAEDRAATVLALAAVNFGSGWHDVVRKRPGCSGATTVALGLRAWAGVAPLTAGRLGGVTVDEAHDIFGQPRGGPAAELTALFATALGDLGRLVHDDYADSFLALVADAGGSAAALVAILDRLPFFHDVSLSGERSVPFFKRAQLAAADLDRAFGGAAPVAFGDLDDLTAFADNLVPHVLRVDGVLAYDPALAARIDAGDLLIHGEAAEVEIRAVAGVHAVEVLRAELAAAGIVVRSSDLDALLWRRGGGSRYKAVRRHRARTTAY